MCGSYYMVLKNRVVGRKNILFYFFFFFFFLFLIKNYGLYFVIPLFPNNLLVCYVKTIDKI